MELAKYDARHCDIEEIKSSMDSLGYVILTNAIDQQALTSLKEELEPYFATRKTSKALFFGFNTKRIEALFKKSKTAGQLAIHPQVMSVVNHVLGDNCDTVQINLTQGIRINAGEQAQMLHPDSAMFPLEDKPFEFIVNSIWAYSDFTKENGATMIVPGSHKWPKDRLPKDEEIMQAEMEAGSVLLYAASLLHGGGENITNEPRTGIAIGYCLGWLRQSENQFLNYPPEVARSFPEELQQLIGYQVHRPNLGWVNGHDPINLITGAQSVSEGAEDFLTEDQKAFMVDFHQGREAALTSHNLKVA